MTTSRPIKLGTLLWNQYTDWPSMRDYGARAEELGYDTLWTWDHLYPIVGSPDGPMLEGYMVIAGWASSTSRSSLGLLVGANTFRNPGVVVKMITTLDHLSSGRAVLGIGGAWFETEHTAFGLEFGRTVGERLDWLDESVELMRAMLHQPTATARGQQYHMRDVRNNPPPIQSHMPILIGGGGERKTLRTVARFADAWNLGNASAEEAGQKLQVLLRHCEDVDRDPAEIELSISLGPVAIRDDPAEAAKLVAGYRDRNTGMTREVMTGSADEIAERTQAYVDLGFRHVIYHLVPPYDDETLERWATEVRPQLNA
jgi:alkanesulfonate monooxygenase SsuD/methylene tetrahydromethanopterin reductase-like flavin-dependent oxidoreductase (luciferase family)